MTQPAKSNWGRWGPDDQLGTLHLMTPERIVRAAGLVRRGKIYNLAAPIDRQTPVHPTRPAPLRMVTFRPTSPLGFGSGEDVIVMNTHTGTHLDPLCHLWYQGEMFNGRRGEEVSRAGAESFAVDRIPAICGRGVLLDVAGAGGVEMLEAGEVIAPADLERSSEREGVREFLFVTAPLKFTDGLGSPITPLAIA